MSEKNIEKIKKEKLEVNEVREYIPFSERIESVNDDESEKSILNKSKDDMEGLYKTVNETRKEVMSYPTTDNNLLMLESFFDHDLVMKDLIDVLFKKKKHVGNEASIRGYEFLNNSVKALAINESEKRFSVKRLFGKGK